MQTGGEALERYAEGRASAAVRELEAAAPDWRIACPRPASRTWAVDSVVVGDELLVRPGELLPCDAVVLEGRSHVDAARLTGEAAPITATAGVHLMSGSLNLDGPLTVRATAPARESQYARIVELVRTAQESKAPLQRLADRYAVWFTPLTLLVCLAAYLLAARSGPRPGGTGGGHAVSAHPRDAGGGRRGASTAPPAAGSSSGTEPLSSSWRR